MLQLLHNLWLLCEFQDSYIKKIFQARLIETIEPSIFEHPNVLVTVNVEMSFEDDFVLRQRAGLICARIQVASA